LTTVIWSPSALHDLQGIRRYIEQFNPRAAKDMAARLIKAGDSLVKSPHRGRPLGDGTRAWSIVHPLRNH
jgi:plasmid stabilization system protein ParE